MGRPKKIEQEKVKVEEIDVTHLVSKEFCKSCMNTDIRKTKDVLAIIMSCLYSVARELELDGDGWNGMVKSLNKWVDKEMKIKWNMANKKKQKDSNG